MPKWAITIPGIGDHDAPERVITMRRNRRSRWAETRSSAFGRVQNGCPALQEIQARSIGIQHACVEAIVT